MVQTQDDEESAGEGSNSQDQESMMRHSETSDVKQAAKNKTKVVMESVRSQSGQIRVRQFGLRPPPGSTPVINNQLNS